MRTSNAKPPLKILHVITGLSRGGAETMLYKLVAELGQNSGFTHSIIALNDENDFDFQSLGVPVTLGNMRGSWTDAAAIRRLGRIAREQRPDIVHGWMYHANAVACLIAPRRTPVIAGIRCTLALSHEKIFTRASISIGPTLIKARGGRMIYCSEQSRRQHEAVGYPTRNALEIPNGFDCELFKPDAGSRSRLLRELGLDPNARLIGHAARFHPMKNHAGLIRAFATVAKSDQAAHLILAGRDVTPENAFFSDLIGQMGITDRIHLLGAREDMNRLVPAFDIYVSSSAWGEAFPNVLGEAMACAVPCVVTDVGESAMIVSDTGRIVPPADNAALAAAIRDVLSLSPDEIKRLGERARTRIEHNFSLPRIAAIYADLYRSLARVD